MIFQTCRIPVGTKYAQAVCTRLLFPCPHKILETRLQDGRSINILTTGKGTF